MRRHLVCFRPLSWIINCQSEIVYCGNTGFKRRMKNLGNLYGVCGLIICCSGLHVGRPAAPCAVRHPRANRVLILQTTRMGVTQSSRTFAQPRKSSFDSQLNNRPCPGAEILSCRLYFRQTSANADPKSYNSLSIYVTSRRKTIGHRLSRLSLYLRCWSKSFLIPLQIILPLGTLLSDTVRHNCPHNGSCFAGDLGNGCFINKPPTTTNKITPNQLLLLNQP